MSDTVLNVGNSLNYNNDYETYVSSPSYQTVNAIKNAGPSPMTTYGPEGNWVEIFSPVVYSGSTAASKTDVSVLIGEQTTGINQNLPGSSVYRYYNSTDGTRTNLFSIGNVQLNLQLQVTGLSATATAVQSIQFYIALNDPSAVIWNPNNSVTALALDNVTNTDTTYSTVATGIPFQTCFRTSTGISGTPVGATVNYNYAVKTAPTTYFSTGTQLYPAGQTVTDVTTKDGYYAMTVAITQLSSASINTTIPTTADNILPQLNSKNGKVFSVTVTLPYYQSTVATETTNYYVDVSSTTTPLYLTIPLVGYYAAPTYSAY